MALEEDEEQMDAALRKFGYVSGQAFQCHTKEEQVKLTMMINVINGWNRLSVGFGMFIDPAVAKAPHDQLADVQLPNGVDGPPARLRGK